MPFVIIFPNLCYEIAKNYKQNKRIILDTKRNVIMDFTQSGIKASFGWRIYGDEFIESQSMEFYENTRKPIDYIIHWLYDDY